ncbi:hypothetical protein [Cytobacillus oceanisediminis]|uniref:hypothetical protein n=1 Tax=Cytobacillus oceanisediminis TaxID=665099 RepID=UPI003735E468
MAQKLLQVLNDFSLGINETVSPNLIPNNALVDAENCILGKGFVKRRGGFVKYSNQLLQPIKTLYEYYKNDGSKEMLAVSDQKIYKDNNGILEVIPFNTITSLSSSQTKMITYKDRNINDVTLIADKGKLKVYNGTDVREVTPHTPVDNSSTGGGNELADPGTNDLSNLTNFRAITLNKYERVFAAAHPTVKNRVSFCHLDPTIGYAVYDYFPATHFFDLATIDNDEIVDLKLFRDAVIVFCKRSIWAIYGDGRTLNDYEIKKINVPDGCISSESIKEVGNNIFYLSNNHIYSLFSTDENFISAEIISHVKETGSNIEQTLKNISLADKEQAVGVFFESKYFLSFPSGLTLVFDTTLGCWTKYTNIKANSFLSRDGVLLFSSDSGYIYRFDENVFNDDGEPINFSLTLKNMDFGYPVNDKKFRRLWTIAQQYDVESSSFNVKAKIDYMERELTDISTDQSLVWGEGNWGEVHWGYKEVVQNSLRIRDKGKNIQLIISSNEIDQPLIIYGFVLQYKLKKAK